MKQEKFDESVLLEQILIILPCVEQFYTLNTVATKVAGFANQLLSATKSRLHL